MPVDRDISLELNPIIKTKTWFMPRLFDGLTVSYYVEGDESDLVRIFVDRCSRRTAGLRSEVWTTYDFEHYRLRDTDATGEDRTTLRDSWAVEQARQSATFLAAAEFFALREA